MIRNCIKKKVDIIHFHWLEIYTGFTEKKLKLRILKLIIFIFDLLLLKIFRKKIVWTMHNLYSHDSYNYNVDKLIRKFTSKIVDAIICHCNLAQIKLLNEFKVKKKKVFVIPTGNYISCYKNDKTEEVSRKLLNLKDNLFVFLYFGRIKPYKDVLSLIRNFKILEQNKNSILLIVGEPTNNQLKSQICKEVNNIENIIVKFEYVPDNEIQIYMNASNVIILPYKRILTSGDILISMGFGKPIIVPKMGCLIDLLDENGSFFYNPLEKNSMIKAMEKSIQLKNKLKEMGTYNFNLANKLEWSGKKHKIVYNKLFNQ